MIKLAIIAIVLSMVAGIGGAGIASCRNAIDSAAGGLEQALGGPATAYQGHAAPAAADGRGAQAEVEMLRSALDRATESMQAAQREIARLRGGGAARTAARTRPRAAAPAPAPERRAPVAATPRVFVAEPVENVAPRRAPPPPPLTIPSETLITVTADALTSSATAVVEDRVTATASGDVVVNGVVVVPSGSLLIGSVTSVGRSGRMRGSESIAVRFHTLVAGGGETAIATEAVGRTGPGQTKQNATRIGGGAAVGAVLGAVFGGSRGAAIGGAIGGAGGTAAAAAQHAPPAVIAAGETLVVRTTRDVTL